MRWLASGERLSIFLPSLGQLRPAEDISVPLLGGPTDCEARLECWIRSLTGVSTPAVSNTTLAFGSELPNGVNTLNTSLARPSQKLRTLKTALITVGVLRPVTRRTLTPPMLYEGSSTEVLLS